MVEELGASKVSDSNTTDRRRQLVKNTQVPLMDGRSDSRVFKLEVQLREKVLAPMLESRQWWKSLGLCGLSLEH